MSSSGRSRRSQMDGSSIASSDAFTEDNVSIDIERDEVKRKSRNLSEKKRRDQFNMLINELYSMVNLNQMADINCQGGKKMDKSSVLRSTISFLKIHSKENPINRQENEDNSSCDKMTENNQLINSWKPSLLTTEEFAYLNLEALNAFILVFEADSNGRILYASESILPLLGLNPSSIVCQQCTDNNNSVDSQCPNSVGKKQKTSIFDLIHESEHSDLKERLIESSNCYYSKSDSTGNNNNGNNYESMIVHFRHYSSTPERESSQSSNNYELVRIVGTHMKLDSDQPNMPARYCFVSICRLVIGKLLKELHILMPIIDDNFKSLGNNEFISRHSLEWKFLFLDHRAPTIIGYLPFEVLGTSGYDYYHWDDLDLVVAGHKQLMQTGASTSCHYRFLTKGQQWIWLKTKYYITYHMWNSKPEFVVCTHTVIGYDERNGINCPESSAAATETSSSLPQQSVELHPQEQFNELINQKIEPQTGQLQIFHEIASSSSSKTDQSWPENSFFKSDLQPESSSSSTHETNNLPYHSIGQISTNDSMNLNYRSNRSHDSSQSMKSNHTFPETYSSSNTSSSEYMINSSNVFYNSQSLMKTNQPSTTAPANIIEQASNTSDLNEDIIQSYSINFPLAPSMTINDTSNDQMVTSDDLQNFLRHRHSLLSRQIKEQQEELKQVSEQLMMVQVVGPDSTNPLYSSSTSTIGPDNQEIIATSSSSSSSSSSCCKPISLPSSATITPSTPPSSSCLLPSTSLMGTSYPDINPVNFYAELTQSNFMNEENNITPDNHPFSNIHR